MGLWISSGEVDIGLRFYAGGVMVHFLLRYEDKFVAQVVVICKCGGFARYCLAADENDKVNQWLSEYDEHVKESR